MEFLLSICLAGLGTATNSISVRTQDPQTCKNWLLHVLINYRRGPRVPLASAPIIGWLIVALAVEQCHEWRLALLERLMWKRSVEIKYKTLPSSCTKMVDAIGQWDGWLALGSLGVFLVSKKLKEFQERRKEERSLQIL